jgi:hypothetical protein
MRVKITYIASDDKEFDSELACRYYEQTLALKNTPKYDLQLFNIN